jgi:3-oxoacyl-[acyl-carrier protein] reductase
MAFKVVLTSLGCVVCDTTRRVVRADGLGIHVWLCCLFFRCRGYTKPMNLSEQTCVVTGGSRGIGRGIAEELGRGGATVVVNYRISEGEATEVVETIEDAGGVAIAAQADVSNRAHVEAMADRVHDVVGPIDVLVNNAGITLDASFREMTWEEWETVLAVNLGGTFTCTKVFYDDIARASQGRLINISSVIGKQGHYGQANYAAAKSGLFGLTRSLALELASTGTTANCVAPGYTHTDMIEGIPEDLQDSLREEIPLGRFARVEEIAGLIAFLASGTASYITGEVIDVNGAMDL